MSAPLPTERGYYIDKDSDLWEHDGRQLFCVGAPITTPEQYAPFTRLLPAAEVIDWIMDRVHDGTIRSSAYRHFGVTE